VLTATQLEKYADVMLWGLATARKERFAKGDVVLVRFGLPALALAEVVQRRLLDRGLNPVLRLDATPAMARTFFTHAGREQLAFLAPGSRELSRGLHGLISLRAPASLTHLREVPPRRIAATAVARKPLRDILWKREEAGQFGWTLCLLPTKALAEHARMSCKAYTREIVRACFLDRRDPVAAWKAIHRRATTIKRRLNALPVKALHVVSANTDLWLTPGRRRRWCGISGHNIPSFEIFLSPDWRGTEGTYTANLPSYQSGNLVQGMRLTFCKGRAVKVEAEKGRDFAARQLAMDPGAVQVGEFSLTDRRFSRISRFMASTLYDENHGGRHGNCHVAVGSSYTDTYDGDPAKLTKAAKRKLGFNDSALHWDLVNTERKTVTARLRNGRETVIYENGVFTV
jgi:aminopeptidase